MESPEETGHGERETQGEMTGQGRLRSPTTVQSAEAKDKRDIIVVVRSPRQENDPADAHPRRAQVSAGVGKPPHGLGPCVWMPLVNGTGQQTRLQDGRPPE